MVDWTASRARECSRALAASTPSEVVNSPVPVVLKGFADAWPAVTEAKRSDEALAAYLRTFDAGLPLTVYRASVPNATIGYTEDITGFTFASAQSNLEHVLSELLNDSGSQTIYIGSTSVDKWLPGFRAANDVAIDGAHPVISFWLGNAVNISAHYDAPCNIACCVAGKRTFTLFPPDQAANLYVGPVDVTPSGRAISLVDFANPDYGRFPKFREAMAHAVVAELEPGDAIFIPPLWWHHVSSTGSVNLLVNYWWHALPAHCGNPDLVLEHAILTMRGLSEEHRRSWKAMFDYYVFGNSKAATGHLPERMHGVLDAKNEDAVRRGWVNFGNKLRR